jgi:hypothetical protein
MLLIILIYVGFGDCGKVLFYMPFISESVKITFMPVATELALRGHSVTIVTPFPDKKVNPTLGIRQISFDSNFMVENIKRISKEKLGVSANDSFPIFELFNVAFTVRPPKFFSFYFYSFNFPS